MIIITTQCFSPEIGGIESLMTGMANAMVSCGENIVVLADGIQGPQDRERNYNIKRFNSWKPIRRIQKANYLKKLCKENDVKSIFADSWKSIEYLNDLNVKIIVLAHGTEIPKQYWSRLYNIFQYKKNRIISSYDNAHKIIANSNYTRELMQASLKISSSKIKVIHPGIDIYGDFISNSDKKKITKIIHNRFPVITTLARVEKRKGHKFVLRSIADLKDQFPNIVYIVAGKGPFLNNIMSYAKELKIEKNVEFLGWITEPEKSLILKNSDLFVMTPTIIRSRISTPVKSSWARTENGGLRCAARWSAIPGRT